MTEEKTTRDISFTQNRELSWLEFNRRVLQEGCDERVPLLERLKFIAIFTSNLDEFFMVRVGSLLNLASVKEHAIDNKTGWTPREQLDAVYSRMDGLYEEKDQAYFDLMPKLEEVGIVQKKMDTLSKKDQIYLEDYYNDKLLPVLSPLVINTRHPFPHLTNQQLYLFVDIEDEKDKGFFGLVPIPTFLPQAIFLPEKGHYILIEDFLLSKMQDLFQGLKLSKPAVVSISRNADINLDEEIDEMDHNILESMKKGLKKRNRLAAVRLEIQGKIGKDSLAFLMKHYNLSEEQVYYAKAPLRMKYVFGIEDHLIPELAKKVTYTPFSPQMSPDFSQDQSLIEQVFEGDKLLHYPYQKMDPFLDLLREAASDPSVLSIKITIYRMASVSKVAEYLARAAENGKEVLALMELRARFDEENNIDYSERLKEAGCTVIYGPEDFKVHSKICQITLFRDEQIQIITQIGTGNYNEKTAKQYTDLAFITCDKDIGADATEFFKNMLITNLDGEYKKLLVAPRGIKPAFLALFDREIEKAKQGLEAKILLKCNSISERDLIDKMMEASQAGVKITMIVRGICCIRPGIPGKTENIRIISVVGRFLEHHRIYAFGSQYDNLYISSADLMTRNIINRVEIACPIEDQKVRQEIIHILEVFLADDSKAKELQPDGSYLPVKGNNKISAQDRFMEEALDMAKKVKFSPKQKTVPLHEKIELQKEDIKESLREEMEEKIREEMKQELKEEIRKEVKQEMKQEVQEKVEEVRQNIKEDEPLGLWGRFKKFFGF